MIVNYNFDKNIKKNGSNFILEINILNKMNNFIYKIYGSSGFFQYGKYSSYKNNDQNNILAFNIDKIQTIFISIDLYRKSIEYFDFINMGNVINNNMNNIKNITIDIKKKLFEVKDDNELKSVSISDLINSDKEDDNLKSKIDNVDTDNDSVADSDTNNDIDTDTDTEPDTDLDKDSEVDQDKDAEVDQDKDANVDPDEDIDK